MTIHPTAIIDPKADLASDICIGPWTIIGADVSIDSGCTIKSHVVIEGPTSIGKHNKIYQFASVGCDTPDLKYKGESTTLSIGDYNTIREGVTLHRGTIQDKGTTQIGNYNLFMAYVHVGHDCSIGNHCILVNNVVLAGHVQVCDWATIGGYSGVQQRCTIGAHSFIAGMVRVKLSVPAFVTIGGKGQPSTINKKGLRRRGFSEASITKITQAFKILYRSNLSLTKACEQIAALAVTEPSLNLMLESLDSCETGIMR